MLSKQLVMEKIFYISPLSESISCNNGGEKLMVIWWCVTKEADGQNVNGEQRVYYD